MRKYIYLAGLFLAVAFVLSIGINQPVAASSDVTICHNPGPYQVIIDVDPSAVEAHVSHGDYVGTTNLLAPAEGELMDNGRDDGTDAIIWDFEWSSCGEATVYHFELFPPFFPEPIQSHPVSEPSFHIFNSGSYIPDVNRFNWRWRVRSLIDGELGPWAEATFDVEPVNTD